MNKMENPIQFYTKKVVGTTEICYSSLAEIVQGGPEIGVLSIDGKRLQGHFGGPLISNYKFIYVPACVQNRLGHGFKLAEIDLTNLEIKLIGRVKDLIFLDRIEEGRVYYFEDLDGSVESYIEL